MSPVSITYWGIPGYAIFWVLFVLAVGLFLHRMYQLGRYMFLGRKEGSFGEMVRRALTTAVVVLGQWCQLKNLTLKDRASIGHVFMAWGFFTFVIFYLVFIIIGAGFGISETLKNTSFFFYYAWVMDIAAPFIIIGALWGIIRRYIVKPPRLAGEQTIEAMVILVTVFIHPMTHLFKEATSIALGSPRPKGALRPIDLETAESFGVAKITDFTWKQLLDCYSCVVCGQCQDACPAYASGKPLNPKKVIQDLKNHLLEVGPQLLKVRGKTEASPVNPGKALIGEVITEDEIWACTTCRACQEMCPVYNEHIDKIIDLRRNLVLEQASIPETAEGALRSIEARGHPWRGTTLSRTDWAEGLEIKTLADDSDVDILYWVGCTEALEDRSVKIAQATGKLLKLAGIKFGILGAEESCCGEPARRLGNEYLFQIQAQKNIELLKGYNVKKIVTACPHCYNTLKNEYPQYGGDFEVIHHTQFFANLLEEGRLRIIKGNGGVVTYHDSCYLGRYNNIYQPPRQLLNNMPDVTVVEMEQNRRSSFCCGGGGGRMWLEERIGRRISELRIEQVLETKAQIVATACPFCLQMFDDAIKAKAVEESLKVMDIAELIAESAVYRPHPV